MLQPQIKILITPNFLNMDYDQINIILDHVILKAATPAEFKGLKRKQKIVGAMKLLVSTATRSGVEIFFTGEYSYLWKETLIGLKLFSDSDVVYLYELIIKNMKAGLKQDDLLAKFQHQITIEKFDSIDCGIKKYTSKNIDEIRVK